MAGEADSTGLTPEQAKQERDKIVGELWEEDGERTTPDASLAAKAGPEPEPGTKESPKQEDPWAGVNPALKVEFEGLKSKAAEFDKVFDRLKQAEKRIGSITNQLSEAQKVSTEAAKKKDTTPAPTKEEIDAAAQSTELWEQLKEDYPQWAEAIDKRLAAERAAIQKELGVTKSLQEEVKALKEAGFSQEKIQEIQVGFAKQLVEVHYPGWEKTVAGKEFTDWIATQPDEVKAKCGTWNAADAIYVLDLFDGRENNGGEEPGAKPRTASEIAQERRKRLAKSETPSAGRVRQPAKRPDDMTDAEYRQHIATQIYNS